MADQVLSDAELREAYQCFPGVSAYRHPAGLRAVERAVVVALATEIDALRARAERAEFKLGQMTERLGMVDSQTMYIVNSNNERWRKWNAEMDALRAQVAELEDWRRIGRESADKLSDEFNRCNALLAEAKMAEAQHAQELLSVSADYESRLEDLADWSDKRDALHKVAEARSDTKET